MMKSRKMGGLSTKLYTYKKRSTTTFPPTFPLENKMIGEVLNKMKFIFKVFLYLSFFNINFNNKFEFVMKFPIIYNRDLLSCSIPKKSYHTLNTVEHRLNTLDLKKIHPVKS